MYQPKVNNTQQYSDSQGEHIVCRGKLLLLKANEVSTIKSNPVELTFPNKIEWVNPIIISETEEIEEGDWVYNRVSKHSSTDSHLYQITRKKQLHNSNQSKILALPEHFSDKHLQAIVDGKMKDGDKVLVKCWGKPNSEDWSEIIWNIHLDKQNHITLFPAEQSLEEAARESANSSFPNKENGILNAVYVNAFKDGVEWAVKNNYNGE